MFNISLNRSIKNGFKLQLVCSDNDFTKHISALRESYFEYFYSTVDYNTVLYNNTSYRDYVDDWTLILALLDCRDMYSISKFKATSFEAQLLSINLTTYIKIVSHIRSLMWLFKTVYYSGKILLYLFLIKLLARLDLNNLPKGDNYVTFWPVRWLSYDRNEVKFGLPKRGINWIYFIVGDGSFPLPSLFRLLKFLTTENTRIYSQKIPRFSFKRYFALVEYKSSNIAPKINLYPGHIIDYLQYELRRDIAENRIKCREGINVHFDQFEYPIGRAICSLINESPNIDAVAYQHAYYSAPYYKRLDIRALPKAYVPREVILDFANPFPENFQGVLVRLREDPPRLRYLYSVNRAKPDKTFLFMGIRDGSSIVSKACEQVSDGLEIIFHPRTSRRLISEVRSEFPAIQEFNDGIIKALSTVKYAYVGNSGIVEELMFLNIPHKKL